MKMDTHTVQGYEKNWIGKKEAMYEVYIEKSIWTGEFLVKYSVNNRVGKHGAYRSEKAAQKALNALCKMIKSGSFMG